jgi:Flp pilus assembly protein TadG
VAYQRTICWTITRRLFASRRGAVSPLFALLLVPLIGAFALAAEASGWYFTQRSMQNAADTAALAAATNGGTTYAGEAAAAAARYGFVNGANNATVAATYPVTCPAGGTTCYQVTITKVTPIFLSRITGFNGSNAVGGGRGQKSIATAIASQRSLKKYCMMTFQHTGNTNSQAFTINGGPSVDLGGCDIYSNHNVKCTSGKTFGIATGNSVGSPNGSQGCGATQNIVSALTDPYAALSTAANIPAASGCSGATTYNNGATINLSSGSKCFTGAVTINGSVTVTNVHCGRGGAVARAAWLRPAAPRREMGEGHAHPFA